jgi:hypothetical protein
MEKIKSMSKDIDFIRRKYCFDGSITRDCVSLRIKRDEMVLILKNINDRLIILKRNNYF